MPKYTSCRVMLVSANADLALNVARCAGRGYSIHAAIAGSLGSLAKSRAVRAVHRLSHAALEGDCKELLTLLERQCNDGNLWVILPVDVAAHLAIARVRHLLPSLRVFPTATEKLIRRMANKEWLTRYAARLGIAVPGTKVLRSTCSAPCRTLNFPVIVKPVHGEGGVHYPCAATMEELSAILNNAQPRPHAPSLVQELVVGDDVGVSVLADGGSILAWTVQRHLPRKRLLFDAYPPALEAVRKLIAATGYSGVAHFDFIDAPGKHAPLLLECNPRFWATTPAAHAAGVCFPSLAIHLALGQCLPPMAPISKTIVRRTPLTARLTDPLCEISAHWAKLLRHILRSQALAVAT